MTGLEMFEKLMEDALKLDNKERAFLFTELLVCSIGMLRHVNGEKWMRGFLKAAIDDNFKIAPKEH